MQPERLIVARGLTPDLELAGLAAPPLDCTIEAGSITCLIGPFGIAKEGYLRALAAVDPPVAGGLELFGRPIVDIDMEEWRALRRRIGFVLRQSPLLSMLNGLENLILPALYHQLLEREEAEQRARELLALAETGCNLSRLPAYLGEYQRRALAIVRALILGPQVLCIDDSFRQLEEAECRQMSRLLTRLARERGIAVVASTFDLRLARDQADQILFLTRERVWRFAGWQDMVEQGNAEVREFIEEESALSGRGLSGAERAR